MEKIIAYFQQKYFVTNLVFGAVFSLPITLGGLFYAMASNNTLAQNCVIIFIAFLTLLDFIYLTLYKIKTMPVFILKILLISDKNKINTVENFYFNNDYNFSLLDEKTIKLTQIERETIVLYSKNTLYKIIVNRLSIIGTFISFLLASFIGSII